MINGGQGGIRTHGRFHADSFLDCCHRPLDHLSVMAEAMRFELMDVAKHRWFSKPLQSTTLPRLRVYKPRKIMVRPTGFEPVTHGLEIRCSSFELWAYMAEVAGFEPAMRESKSRGLTACRHLCMVDPLGLEPRTSRL